MFIVMLDYFHLLQGQDIDNKALLGIAMLDKARTCEDLQDTFEAMVVENFSKTLFCIGVITQGGVIT